MVGGLADIVMMHLREFSFKKVAAADLSEPAVSRRLLQLFAAPH